MELKKINEQLEETTERLAEKIIELAKAEYVYEKRFCDLIVHSGMGTALLKESEAKLTLDQEGLWEPLTTLRADVRALYHLKDTLLAISANTRTMQHHDTEKEEYYAK